MAFCPLVAQGEAASRDVIIRSLLPVTSQARIQDSEGGGGVSYIQKGGFRTGISGADPNCCRVLGKSTSKNKLQTAVGGGGGGPNTQKKTLYPRMQVVPEFPRRKLTNKGISGRLIGRKLVTFYSA